MSPGNPPTSAYRRVSAYRRGRTALVIAAGYAAIVILASIAEALAIYLPAEVTGLAEGPRTLWLLLVTLPISIPIFLLTALPVPAWLDVVLYHSLTVGGLFQAWLLWRILRGRKTEPA